MFLAEWDDEQNNFLKILINLSSSYTPEMVRAFLQYAAGETRTNSDERSSSEFGPSRPSVDPAPSNVATRQPHPLRPSRMSAPSASAVSWSILTTLAQPPAMDQAPAILAVLGAGSERPQKRMRKGTHSCTECES